MSHWFIPEVKFDGDHDLFPRHEEQTKSPWRIQGLPLPSENVLTGVEQQVVEASDSIPNGSFRRLSVYLARAFSHSATLTHIPSFTVPCNQRTRRITILLDDSRLVMSFSPPVWQSRRCGSPHGRRSRRDPVWLARVVLRQNPWYSFRPRIIDGKQR